MGGPEGRERGGSATKQGREASRCAVQSVLEEQSFRLRAAHRAVLHSVKQEQRQEEAGSPLQPARILLPGMDGWRDRAPHTHTRAHARRWRAAGRGPRAPPVQARTRRQLRGSPGSARRRSRRVCPGLPHAARAHTHTHARTHSRTLTHAHTHIQTHAHTHPPTRARTHSHTPSLTHTLAHSHTHTHTLIYICTHTFTHTHAHILSHIHTHAHTPTRARTHTLTCTYTHVHTHTHILAHTLIHTRALAHARTHAQEEQ